MTEHVVLLTIPGLRRQDAERMPNLKQVMEPGESATLTPHFPAVTWPVQANMLTGKLAHDHGVIANGFYWRDKQEVEMWTAWNEKIQAPQIWDLLHEHDEQLTSAVWFPMLSKGSGADYICMPAPIHNPDGSESLWCYTKPVEFYGELRDKFGHFPLKHFWGPLANIQSSAWICESAAFAAEQFKPRFFHIYIPHLDYAAQKLGPDSDAANEAVQQLDQTLGDLIAGFGKAFGQQPLWLVASEYVITPVDHVTYPNRVLRNAGLLQVKPGEEGDSGEYLDLDESSAWTLVDHQAAHVFVRDRQEDVINRVVDLFRNQEGIAEVLAGDDRGKYGLDHERSGDVVLVSTANSWQAYYWWNDDDRCPNFARTVDIHRKPGYDPVELHFDMATRSIPLDATLIKGSHGAPPADDSQKGILLSSQKGVCGSEHLADTDICSLVLKQFGVSL